MKDVHRLEKFTTLAIACSSALTPPTASVSAPANNTGVGLDDTTNGSSVYLGMKGSSSTHTHSNIANTVMNSSGGFPKPVSGPTLQSNIVNSLNSQNFDVDRTISILETFNFIGQSSN